MMFQIKNGTEVVLLFEFILDTVYSVLVSPVIGEMSWRNDVDRLHAAVWLVVKETHRESVSSTEGVADAACQSLASRWKGCHVKPARLNERVLN